MLLTLRSSVQRLFLLTLLVLLPLGGLRSADLLRQEQRISDFLPAENMGSVMEADGDWAALGSSYPYRGKLMICRRQSGTWSVTQTLETTDGGSIGSVLALSGDWLAVREYKLTTLRDGQTSLYGVVRLFHQQGGRWVLVQTLSPSLQDVGPGIFDFGTRLELKGDRLVVLMSGYSEPDGSGQDYETLLSSLFSYRRNGGIWQLEQKLPDKIVSSVHGSPSLSLHEGWLAVGDFGALSKEWQPSGRVHLFRLEAGRWKLAQTLSPPADKSLIYFGMQVGLADGGNLLITSLNGVWASTLKGRQWTPPKLVETGPVDDGVPFLQLGLPPLSVRGSMAALKLDGLIQMLRLEGDHWQPMRKIPVIIRQPHLALSEDTVLFPSDFVGSSYQWQSVSFLPLADLEVRLARPLVQAVNSRKVAESPLVAPGSEVVWQQSLDGAEMPFVVKNTTPSLMPRPAATLDGAMAASFEIVPQDTGPLLMAPGDSMTYILRPRQGMLITDAPLTVTLSTAGVLPDFSFQVRWRLPAGTLQGSPQVKLLSGAFWVLGKPVQLVPVISDVPVLDTPNFRWLHNGVEMVGQNRAVLVLAEIKPEHAGRYELEVRLQSGTTKSNPFLAAVFEPLEQVKRLRDGDTARLETRIWGSAQVDWQNPANYQDITSPYLAGITLPTLTVLDGRWIDPSDTSELEAIATLVDPTTQTQVAWAVVARHRLISFGRKPTVIPVHANLYAVGDSISESVAHVGVARDAGGGRGGWPGSQVTASGLPPGIQLVQQGTLEGTFEKAGIYPVTWRIRDASGVWSNPVVSEFIVGQTGPALVAGLHVGWISGPGESDLFSFGGCLELRSELNGAFSGVVKLPGAIRRFAGKLRSSPDAPEWFEADIPLPPCLAR